MGIPTLTPPQQNAPLFVNDPMNFKVWLNEKEKKDCDDSGDVDFDDDGNVIETEKEKGGPRKNRTHKLNAAAQYYIV